MNKVHAIPVALIAVAGSAAFLAACTSRGVAVEPEGDASTTMTIGGGADASGHDAAPVGIAISDGGAEAAVLTNGIPVGAPCTLDQEDDVTYAGGNYREIGVVPDAPDCNGGVCVIDHFNGRTSCPYGQSADGSVPYGAPGPCTLPGTSTLVQAAVEPWCSSRPPSQVVTCSCRCADLDGGTDDSGTFCACPDGYTCTQLVGALGAGVDTSITGAYCIKAGTAFMPNDAGVFPQCTYCDPTTNPCP